MTAMSIQEPLFFTHPKLQAVVDDFVRGVQLSLYRALPQHGRKGRGEGRGGGGRTPMPSDPDSLEQIFASYLSLPRAARSARAALQRASMPPVPAGVNLMDATPVLDQMLS